MRTLEGNQIRDTIAQHTGRAQSISAQEICQALGWPISRERRVRQIIQDESALWQSLVCACANGYFVAETFEEAEAYENWLRGLADAANAKLATFRALLAQHGLFVPIAKGRFVNPLADQPDQSAPPDPFRSPL